MIPSSTRFDQSTLAAMLDVDPLVQQYRAFFALLDWSPLARWQAGRTDRGHHGHPLAAYLKAFLVRLCEGHRYTTQLRRFLLTHPLLVIDLGFQLKLDPTQPYGFDVEQTLPCDFWLRQQLRHLDQRLLQALLHASVHALQAEIPGLGEVVAFDVKHIYGWVKENNPRVYTVTEGRFDVTHHPKGDPDCRLGVKRSTNQVQADGSKKERKESLFGYGSGVAAATDPVYGDVVLAEYTQPFNENDITYFQPLYTRTVVALDAYPTHLTADAAFDAHYVYERAVRHGGIAAIPLNEHGHDPIQREPDGVPLCPIGLRMIKAFDYQHPYGYTARRFRCPLLFPLPLDFTCKHPQFAKGKGCVKDANWTPGGLQRVLLNRDGPLYHTIYNQRTSCERINSQSQALGIERPKVRNIDSVRNLNTLIYLVINTRALQRAHSINTALLQMN